MTDASDDVARVARWPTVAMGILAVSVLTRTGITLTEAGFVNPETPLALILIARALWQGRDGHRVLDPVATCGIGLLVLVGAGVLYADDPDSSADTLITILRVGVLPGAAIALTFTQLSQSRWLVRSIVFGSAALGALALLGFASGADLGGFGVKDAGRLVGTHDDPNFLGQAYGAITIAALGLVAAERQLRWRLAVVVAGLTSAGVVVASGSRGALIGCALGVIAIGLLGIISGSRLLKIGMAAGFAVLVLVVVAGTNSDRVDNLFEAASSDDVGSIDSSIASRARLYETAVVMFAEQPLVGVGSGNYDTSYLEYSELVPGNNGLRQATRAHSLPLEIASELGAVGAMLAAFALFLQIRRTTRGVRRRRAHEGTSGQPLGPRPTEAAGNAEAMLGALIAWLGAGLFLHLSRPGGLLVLAAAVGAMTTSAKATPEPPSASNRARPAGPRQLLWVSGMCLVVAALIGGASGRLSSDDLVSTTELATMGTGPDDITVERADRLVGVATVTGTLAELVEQYAADLAHVAEARVKVAVVWSDDGTVAVSATGADESLNRDTIVRAVNAAVDHYERQYPFATVEVGPTTRTQPAVTASQSLRRLLTVFLSLFFVALLTHRVRGHLAREPEKMATSRP